MTSIATILNENPLHAKIFSISGEISAKIGIPSYVVGGYVRDALLRRKTNDVDIMVDTCSCCCLLQYILVEWWGDISPCT